MFSFILPPPPPAPSYSPSMLDALERRLMLAAHEVAVGFGGGSPLPAVALAEEALVLNYADGAGQAGPAESRPPQPPAQPPDPDCGRTIDCSQHENPQPGYWEEVETRTIDPLNAPPDPQPFAEEYALHANPDGGTNGAIWSVHYDWAEGPGASGTFGQKVCIDTTITFSESVELGASITAGYAGSGIEVSRTKGVSIGIDCTYGPTSEGPDCFARYEIETHLQTARVMKQSVTSYADGRVVNRGDPVPVGDGGYRLCHYDFKVIKTTRRWVSEPQPPGGPDPRDPTVPPADDNPIGGPDQSPPLSGRPPIPVAGASAIFSNLLVDADAPSSGLAGLFDDPSRHGGLVRAIDIAA